LRTDGNNLVLAGLPAAISSVVVDQGGIGRAWFASSDSGFVGRTSSGVIDTIIRGRFKRVMGLAFDDLTRTLWVSDGVSGVLVHLDSAGRELHRITGLQRPTAISAAGGRVWLVETGAGKIRSYDNNGNSLLEISGFTGPLGIGVVPHDPTRAWVADTENGRLVLVHENAIEASTVGQGLRRPNVLVVHRGAP
jgi:streptogramin lyase